MGALGKQEKLYTSYHKELNFVSSQINGIMNWRNILLFINTIVSVFCMATSVLVIHKLFRINAMITSKIRPTFASVVHMYTVKPEPNTTIAKEHSNWNALDIIVLILLIMIILVVTLRKLRSGIRRP